MKKGKEKINHGPDGSISYAYTDDSLIVDPDTVPEACCGDPEDHEEENNKGSIVLEESPIPLGDNDNVSEFQGIPPLQGELDSLTELGRRFWYSNIKKYLKNEKLEFEKWKDESKNKCEPLNEGYGVDDGRKKESNPKDRMGIKKTPISTVSGPVIMEVGLAMLEGAIKYGRHNYREVGVRASIYYDAASRHMIDWWEGTDTDPDSGLNHVTKAIASLVVLRDSMIRGNWEDDRPPKCEEGWMAEFNKKAEEILKSVEDIVQAAVKRFVSVCGELILN